jgi:hypothetical protein
MAIKTLIPALLVVIHHLGLKLELLFLFLLDHSRLRSTTLWRLPLLDRRVLRSCRACGALSRGLRRLRGGPLGSASGGSAVVAVVIVGRVRLELAFDLADCDAGGAFRVAGEAGELFDVDL